MNWIDALKEFNKGSSTWCIPKKGSEGYNKVKSHMTNNTTTKNLEKTINDRLVVKSIVGNISGRRGRIAPVEQKILEDDVKKFKQLTGRDVIAESKKERAQSKRQYEKEREKERVLEKQNYKPNEVLFSDLPTRRKKKPF